MKRILPIVDYYTIGKESFKNRYLAGEVNFEVEDYQRWFKKLNITRA